MTFGISRTVAGIAAGSHIPVPQAGPDHIALLVLAIGARLVFFRHVNDACFWMVREFFALRLQQTLMVWSALQSIFSVVELAGTSPFWWLTT